MCAIPAQVAGVERIALASPPGPDGDLHPLVLAAAALCGVEEIYAMGGAQAIFALAYGTETIAAGRRDRRPRQRLGAGGQARASTASVGIDSLAGPSELMLVAGHDTDPEWAALDLCAQAEHGADSPLVVVAVEEHVLDAIADADRGAPPPRARASPTRRWRWSRSPTSSDAIDLANAFAPEHLELLRGGRGAARRAGHDRRLRLRRPLRRHRLRRLRRRLQPRAADRRRRALLRPARARRPSAAGSPTVEIDGRRGGGAGAARRRPRPRRGLPRPRRVGDD